MNQIHKLKICEDHVDDQIKLDAPSKQHEIEDHTKHEDKDASHPKEF